MTLASATQSYDSSEAIALIGENDDGPFTWSLWDQVSVAALIESRTSGAGPTFGYADRDWWTLLTILSKTEWMKSLHAAGEIDQGQWMYFAATEIDFFHVRFRSLLDHLAALLSRCATRPQTVPEKFFDLKKFLDNPKKKQLFGSLADDVLGLLNDAGWAEDVRTVRDSIVHFGADTLVFPDEHDILFQVHRRQSRLVLLDRVMHNENIVDFRKYAALTLGLLLLWRERAAGVLRRGFDLELDKPNEGWNHHPGLAHLQDWSTLLSLDR